MQVCPSVFDNTVEAKELDVVQIKFTYKKPVFVVTRKELIKALLYMVVLMKSE